MKGDLMDDYCSDHGGWGSWEKPCKICGRVRTDEQIPEIPKGLSFDEALAWGAEQINKKIMKQHNIEKLAGRIQAIIEARFLTERFWSPELTKLACQDVAREVLEGACACRYVENQVCDKCCGQSLKEERKELDSANAARLDKLLDEQREAARFCAPSITTGPEAGEGYELVQVGDVLRDGDQWKSGLNNWSPLPAQYLGNAVRANQHGAYPFGYYRRPTNKGVGFAQALEWLREGKSVRRAKMPKTALVRVWSGQLCYFFDTSDLAGGLNLEWADLTANDWEVVP